MNFGLAGMLIGTALAVGLHWVVSNSGRPAQTHYSDLFLRSLALVFVGGFVGLFWGVTHLTVEEFDAGTQSRQDYDDSIRRKRPPSST